MLYISSNFRYLKRKIISIVRILFYYQKLSFRLASYEAYLQLTWHTPRQQVKTEWHIKQSLSTFERKQ